MAGKGPVAGADSAFWTMRLVLRVAERWVVKGEREVGSDGPLTPGILSLWNG